MKHTSTPIGLFLSGKTTFHYMNSDFIYCTEIQECDRCLKLTKQRFVTASVFLFVFVVSFFISSFVITYSGR